ncbi:heparan-alpha-glucosaminide n-acetyltransferase [Quercus suber]|uniref:Heparan-alpha-glucosaminide n-acetyltransferase n=1 Tax=Quercus suber TaxID=58331 RepID=A0AAW0JJK2_QUESU
MEDARRLEEGFGHAPLEKKDHNKAYFSEKLDGTDRGDCIENEKDDRRAVLNQPTERNVEEQPLVKPKSKRLMILVDDAGGAYARIDHSPWNGCTLADFVMPFFLFIVGVAITLALKKVPNIKHAIKKIVIRTLKLLFWGIILQGGYSHAPNELVYGVDIKHQIRWCGILQRIALVYFVVALIETLTTKLRPTVLDSGHISIFTAYRWQWIGGFVAFLIYIITTYALYIPDWSFVLQNPDGTAKRYTVQCGMRGHLGPACNAVGYVDRQVWGIEHLYSQPVWIRLKVSTYYELSRKNLLKNWLNCMHLFFVVPINLSCKTCRLAHLVLHIRVHYVKMLQLAILSGTIGIHYGHVLIHFKSHSERLKQWVSMGFGLLIIAIILHFTNAIPINKQLYSISYVCFTAGAAGMNAMLVFVMAAQGIFAAFVNGWYYESQDKTLVYWIQKHVFNDVWHSEKVGTLLYVMFAEITFWSVVAGILHKLGIYWKL